MIDPELEPVALRPADISAVVCPCLRPDLLIREAKIDRHAVAVVDRDAMAIEGAQPGSEERMHANEERYDPAPREAILQGSDGPIGKVFTVGALGERQDRTRKEPRRSRVT